MEKITIIMETNQTLEVGNLTTKVGIWSCLTRKHGSVKHQKMENT